MAQIILQIFYFSVFFKQNEDKFQHFSCVVCFFGVFFFFFLFAISCYFITLTSLLYNSIGPRQANLVLIAYARSEGSGEPAHPRRACASAQSRQNLRYSLIQAVSQEEPSDRKPDPWPFLMAGHAQLKFGMMECSKTQIRLTGLNCLSQCFEIDNLTLKSLLKFIKNLNGPRRANLCLRAFRHDKF